MADRQPRLVRVTFLAAALLALAAVWGPAVAGAFTGPTNFPVGETPRSVAAGDFNGDSRPDLAVANSDSNDLSVLLGDGRGGFTAAPGSPVPVGTSPQSVAVGDFNGDAHADLAVANVGSNNVSILLGNGGGQFVAVPSGPVPAGANPISIAVADFNGDSDPDLAIANYGSHGVTIMLGGAGASFAPALGSPLLAGSFPFSIAVGNFNGDSDPDLAVANSGSNDVSILLGAPGGSFTPAPGSPVAAGTSPHSVGVGDFNGDSRTDLAVANYDSNDVSVLLGNGGGGFAPTPGSPLAVGTAPAALAVADFNGDPDPDLAVVNEGSGNVSILLGASGGSFTAAPGGPIMVSFYPVAIAVGDFNGDSAPDFAVTNSGFGNISVLLAGTGASFTPTAGSPLPVGANPRSIAGGDFNGDPHRDLAVANNGSNDVTILLGGAGGTFTPAAGSPISAGNSPFSVAVGDFNGDTRADLAVANIGSNDVSILLGDGSGGFAPAAGSPVPVGGGPVWVTVGRFNGDSHPDLAVANLTSNDVTILLGNGAGAFAPAAGSPIPVGAGPISIAAGDFNGDSRPDLAVGNSSSDDVSILLGNGAGGFATAPGSPVPAGNYPHMVAVRDFDGDSRDDIVVVNYESDNVSILLGNGSAGFTSAPGSPFAVGTCPESAAIADFNGDSHLDLVVANAHSGNLSLLLGRSDGTFTAAPGVSLPSGTAPIALEVGNFNGDSRPDLALASYTTAGVWILLASSPPTLAIDDVTHPEGNSATTPYTFTVTRSGDTSAPASVHWATADGSASAPGDYVQAAGALQFAPGELSKTITLAVRGDTTPEPNETFEVRLSGASGAQIADGEGVGTIENDDLSPSARCTITGTNKNDVISGTPGDDVICAGNGDDRVYGLGGRDVLIGGNGKDTLEGGPGADLLVGGNGKDTLDARDGAPNDVADGGNGPDVCRSDAGDFVAGCP